MQIKPNLNVKVSKINTLSNIAFILNVLLEDRIIFVWRSLFFKIKKKLISGKCVFFLNEAACTCVNMRKRITSKVSIVPYVAIQS